MPASPGLRIATALAALIASGVVRAEPFESADMQAARRHYTSGRTLYEEGNYREACQEFSTARKILVVPALDYNLAKCEERLEHWSRAIELYERYLSEVGPEVDQAQVKTRVGELRIRVAELSPAPLVAPKSKTSPLRIAAISLAAGAVVLGAVGTGGYLSEWSAYTDKRSACNGSCPAGSFPGLVHGIDRARDAGAVLWAIAGVAAVADVVLWVVDGKQHRERATHVATGFSF